MPKPLAPNIIEALDPGIRRIVLWMRGLGFETTDSGDGVTKPARGEDWTEGVPHVYAVLPSLSQAPQLVKHLTDALEHRGFRLVQACSDGKGNVVDQPKHGDVWVQVTYDAANGVTVLSLHGARDDMLDEIEEVPGGE